MVLLIGFLPSGHVPLAKAESLLTFETAQKFKEIIAAEESRISILQDDGTVSETNLPGEKTTISEWKDISSLVARRSFTAGLKKEGTVVVSNGYPWDLPEKIADWKDIKSISASDSSLMGLKNDGTVVVAGDSSRDVSDWKDIVGIAAGLFHYAGLKSDGTVVAKGQYPASYADCANWKDIIDISVGNSHTAGLKKDGTVVATGLSEDVSGWNNIVAISSGAYHLVGLKSDGTVVGAGWNNSGQLNFKDWKNIVAVTAGDSFTVGLKSDGTIVMTGDLYGAQKNTANWNDIAGITAGEKNIVGLKKDGTVVAQGGNGNGQNNVSQWSNIIQVSAGAYHTLGLKKDGTVISVGNTGNGEDRVGGWTGIKQLAAGAGFSIGLKTDGTLVGTGWNGYSQTNVWFWSNIVKVAAGDSFTIGLKQDGTVVETQGKYSSQLFVNTWLGIKDIAAGHWLAVGLRDNGTVVAKGNNNYGETNVDGWRGIIAVAAGDHHTVGLKQDGTVVATGLNTYDQTNVQDWKDIVAIAAGSDCTVGLKSDGTVVTTGWTGQAASNSVAVDKQVAKPGDTVDISLKNSRFYTTQSKEYSLIGSVSMDGQLESQYGRELGTSYLVNENDIGRVNISLPGTVDFFGNSLKKQDLFEVVPLQSITSSKTDAKSGEKVTLTVVFYQPVNQDFKLLLDGAVHLDAVSMTEVAGSNGKKFIFQYTLPVDYKEGAVNASLKNITMADGSHFDPYTEENVFTKSNRPAPVSTLTVSQKQAKIGDLLTITAKFSEKVGSNIQLSLDGGANLQGAVMTEVPGSVGQEFIYNYYVPEGSSGAVNAHLTNVFDSTGNLCEEYKEDNLFETDGVRPNVVRLETSQPNAKLGDKLVLTATFSEPVKSGVKVILYGGTEYKDLDMTQVPGSNALKYSYEYTVVENDYGTIQAVVHNFEDQAGNQNSYYVNNLFYADGKMPSLVSIQSDEKVYKRGDYAHITAEFSEPVKQGVKIKLSGAIKDEEYPMSAVTDSQGKKFEMYYEIKKDQYRFLNTELTNIEDTAGNVATASSPKLFYISDPSNANLEDITLGDIQLSTAFSPDITEYKAIVPMSLKTINIHAKAEDSDAVVSGSGNISLALGENNYTLTATSKDGTKKDYHLIVNAVDVDTPILEGITDMTIKVGDSFDPKNGITAKDDVDGDLTSAIKITGNVDTAKPGAYILEHTVTDKSGNSSTTDRKITVIDDVKPEITGVVDKTIPIGTVFDPAAGVKAIDNADGDLTSSIQISGSVNVKAKGIYWLTYTVKDSSGNETTVARKITVYDNVKPVLTGITDKTIYINSAFNPRTGVGANDNVDGNLIAEIKISGTVNTKIKGVYVLSYSVMDKSGNSASAVQKVTVKDNVKPVISGVTEKVLYMNASFNPRTGIRAIDNSDGDLTALIRITGTVNTKVKGTYYLTYSVTDKSGNTATVVQRITVKDNIKPIIYGATSKTIKRYTSLNPRAGVTAKDNADGYLTSSIKISGSFNTRKRGTYTLTYYVYDKSGNKATVIRKIMVK